LIWTIKTLKKASMPAYKRNQVEEAISRLLEPGLAEPSAELRTRLKRLLDTDRALGRSPEATDPEEATYAFYSDEAPGSGIEVWFSGYEAFALLTGLRLMEHEWPQSFAVSVMRQVRAELEKEHAGILKRDPKTLFDQAEIRRNARAGDMAVDNTDPSFLTIVSRKDASNNRTLRCSIRQGVKEAWGFVWKEHGRGGAGAVTMFELATSAHRLADELARTEPRRRGR
jgi:hypothetical protein